MKRDYDLQKMIRSTINAPSPFDFAQDWLNPALHKLLIHAAGEKSTVHGKQMSSNKACCVRSKKHSSTNQLVKLPKALHGRTHQEFFSACRAFQQMRIQFGLVHARCNGIHAYSVF